MCWTCKHEGTGNHKPGFTHHTKHTLNVLKGYGIVPMNLGQELADFYMLENLTTVHHSKQAAVMLKTKEQHLAHAFGRYFDMIIGGELRHWPSQQGCYECGGDGRQTCWDCDGDGQRECWPCDGNGSIDCRECSGDGWNYCDECDGHGTLTDDDGTQTTCSDCNDGRADCGACSGEGSATCDLCMGEGNYECDSCYGNGYFDCEYCDGDHDMNGPLEQHPIWKFADKVWNPTAQTKKQHTGKRNFAWAEWKAYRKKHGIAALEWAVDCFKNGGWRGGYGGEAWAGIAKLTYDWHAHKISDRVFVNMAWSVQHNGGCAFDKVYEIGEADTYSGRWRWSLQDLLNEQARDRYDRLERFASPEVRKLWRAVTYKQPRMRWSPEWLGVQDVNDYDGYDEELTAADVVFHRLMLRAHSAGKPVAASDLGFKNVKEIA